MQNKEYGLVGCNNSECKAKHRLHMHLKTPECTYEPIVLSKAIAMHQLAFLSDVGLNFNISDFIEEQITSSNLPDTHEEDDSVKKLLSTHSKEIIKEIRGVKKMDSLNLKKLTQATVALSHAAQGVLKEGVHTVAVIITEDPNGNGVANVYVDGVLQEEPFQIMVAAEEAQEKARVFALSKIKRIEPVRISKH